MMDGLKTNSHASVMDEDTLDCQLCGGPGVLARVWVRFPDRSAPGCAMTLCTDCIDRYRYAGARITPTTLDGLAPAEGALF